MHKRTHTMSIGVNKLLNILLIGSLIFFCAESTEEAHARQLAVSEQYEMTLSVAALKNTEKRLRVLAGDLSGLFYNSSIDFIFLLICL